ncbi:MAG: 50S ribosomal protein L9 [Verrucomicrobia bacterium]|nr:MAG: 50S ribosomal protein L9 [Verrucomicrobiota bacterium]
MPKTEVILIHNVVGLGGESDQVKVNAGYARNFLVPQGLAIPMTQSNKRRLEALRQRRAEREATELNTMSELGRNLSKMSITVSVKTGDDGKVFGSVTTGSIADALKTQLDVSLDKRKIHLERAIHTLGEHEVELRLHPDVKASIKVIVSSSNPPPEVVADATGEAVKTEKRSARAVTGRKGEVPSSDVKPAKK